MTETPEKPSTLHDDMPGFGQEYSDAELDTLVIETAAVVAQTIATLQSGPPSIDKRAAIGILKRHQEKTELMLGPKQTTILLAVKHLEDLAYATGIAHALNARAENKVSPTQVTVTLVRLSERGMIELAEIRKMKRSPPIKIFRMTPKGERALELTLKKFAGALR